MGIKVDVICAKFDGVSSWDNDVKDYSDSLLRLVIKKPFTPFHLTKLPENLIEKIRWKYSLWRWEKQKSQFDGNYRDLSKPMILDFLNETIRVINENLPSVLILSVGPFSYSEILPVLKKKFPQLKLVIDYRDYWEDEFSGLTDKQIQYENSKQETVLSSVDLVLCPNFEMKNYFEKSVRNVYCLPHCIDTDDFINLPFKPTSSINSIQLIYGGAFYSGLSDTLLLIRKFIQLLSEKNTVQADFFVSVKGYETELSHPLIKRSGFIDTAEYFANVIAADFVLLILPENRKNSQSSKFYELVALKKPILYFGPQGTVSEYILKHGLGLHIHSANLEAMVEMVIEEKKNPTLPLSINIQDKTFEFQTKLLLDKLSEL